MHLEVTWSFQEQDYKLLFNILIMIVIHNLTVRVKKNYDGFRIGGARPRTEWRNDKYKIFTKSSVASSQSSLEQQQDTRHQGK